MPSHRDPIRALIIGVADYPALGAAQTALGADHDAVAWSAIAGAVGYRTDQIFVRRSPPLPKSAAAPYLPPAKNRKGAKAAKVLKSIQKLVDSLRANPGGRGLLVYSGHGTVINGELHLCPADTAWENGSLINTISMDQILDMIGDALPGLTVVLDCCFAGALEGSGGAGIPAAPTRVLPGHTTDVDVVALATQKRDSFAQKGVVLLSACGPGQSAYAYSFRPNLALPPAPHGVFTASISALLQRWSPPDAPGSVPYPIDYDTLIAHSRNFLAAMDFDQSPAWTGPADAGAHHAFYGDQGDTLDRAPKLPGREISGGNDNFWFGVVRDGSPADKVVGMYIENNIKEVVVLGPAELSSSDSYHVTAATAEDIVGLGTEWVTTTLKPDRGEAQKAAGSMYLSTTQDDGRYIGFVLMFDETLFYFWAKGPADNSRYVVSTADENLEQIMKAWSYENAAKNAGTAWTEASTCETGDGQWLIQRKDTEGNLQKMGVQVVLHDGSLLWYQQNQAPLDVSGGLYFTMQRGVLQNPKDIFPDATIYQCYDQVIT